MIPRPGRVNPTAVRLLFETLAGLQSGSLKQSSWMLGFERRERERWVILGRAVAYRALHCGRPLLSPHLSETLRRRRCGCERRSVLLNPTTHCGWAAAGAAPEGGLISLDYLRFRHSFSATSILRPSPSPRAELRPDPIDHGWPVFWARCQS